MRKPSASPGPRKLRIEVRLALSYDALKMKGTFSDRVTPLITSAMNSACFSLSIMHGPAMRNKATIADADTFDLERNGQDS
jgi:hypothetical protein